ncbi:hypothetical protein [Breznakiella homolactica]|uniref:Adenylate kinase n=1 Tax=Breznakiella homolactica TaxID=2798577 RepID=A0A7T7XLF3_9SPIR|nr:hypothetical protein [Breznakiella homolactica]QQO08574.1 hypothetical protein JFL75_16805 [Breznakiella homolactica]
MKIAILGFSGSGKSTLAKHLGLSLGIPVLYLDTVQFGPGWAERDRTKALGIVAGFMLGDSWIIEGNYVSFFQNERLEQADFIIYLDFSRLACLRRAVRRFFQYRNKTRESMAAGCREKFDPEFAWWILYKGRTPKKRAYYAKVLEKYKDKAIVIRNQKQLDRIMRSGIGFSDLGQFVPGATGTASIFP